MNANNMNLTRKATAVLSAIATSSLLGVPVLAQSVNSTPDASQFPAECAAYMNQSSVSQMNTVQSGAGFNASTQSTNQFGNQADMRSNSMSMSQQSTGEVTRPVAYQADSSMANRSGMMNDQARMSPERTPAWMLTSAPKAGSALFGNVNAGGGATTGGASMRNVFVASNADKNASFYRETSLESNNNLQSNSMQSGYSQSSASSTGDVLASGGTTTGGTAAQIQENAVTGNSSSTVTAGNIPAQCIPYLRNPSTR